MEIKDKIYIVDNGSQYTHLIASKIRSLKVYSEIVNPNVSANRLQDARGIILSGSPYSVYDDDAPDFNTEIFELGKPVLGLCYGLQLMAHHLGGEVRPGNTKEYGIAELQIKETNHIFKNLNTKETVWMSHGDAVDKIPSGFKQIGLTQDCPFAAIADFERAFYGLQFHPEVDNTPKGIDILRNFTYSITGSKPSWTMKNFINQKTQEIKNEVKDRDVLLLVSGGVDSTVSAGLLEKALGPEKVYALHIDNGLMRKNESEEVITDMKKLGFKNIYMVDASQKFYDALGEETDPEEKRKIIGAKFIDVANEEASKLSLQNWILGQGTIYPDTIESGGTKHASVIKTHHNRVGIIQEMIRKGQVIEPLRELYKTEVREVGEEIGLPKNRVWRHPFPGPGLGIRVLCAKEETIPKEVFDLNTNVTALASKLGFDSKVLPIKSVGVKGDARSYEYPVAIFGMEINWQELESVSTRITNEIRGINRVVYTLIPETIVSAKPIVSHITKERVDLLREADNIVMKNLENSGLMSKVWQCPTVLLPVSVNDGGESIVLRPVLSERAMTAKFADLPVDFVNKISKEISKLGVSAVFYDITHKPPGTIEWE